MPRLIALVAAAIMLPGAPSAVAQAPLPRGAVIERVPCASRPEMTYALYLPTAYAPGRAWPILYAFDPLGRGAVPVELFREAAERHGVIVACSNDSRNGPLADSMKAFQAVWDDTHVRLAVDARRVYAAGFSGGARVANALAAGLPGVLAGVAAFGAGLPAGLREEPRGGWDLFLAAGLDDFNFGEVRALAASFEARGAAVRFVTFEGPHRWPPASVAGTALAWFDVRAMRSGARARDEGSLNAYEAEQRARAADLEAGGHALELVAHLRAWARDLEGLRDVAEPKARSEALARSKDAKSGSDRAKEEDRRQSTRAGEVEGLLRAALDGEDRFRAASELRQAVAGLTAKASAPADSLERTVARRVLGGLRAAVIQEGAGAVERGEARRALAVYDLASLAFADEGWAHYRLAVAAAVAKDRGRALKALRRAAELGGATPEVVAAERAFDALRADPEFPAALRPPARPPGP